MGSQHWFLVSLFMSFAASSGAGHGWIHSHKRLWTFAQMRGSRVSDSEHVGWLPPRTVASEAALAAQEGRQCHHWRSQLQVWCVRKMVEHYEVKALLNMQSSWHFKLMLHLFHVLVCCSLIQQLKSFTLWLCPSYCISLFQITDWWHLSKFKFKCQDMWWRLK